MFSIIVAINIDNKLKIKTILPKVVSKSKSFKLKLIFNLLMTFSKSRKCVTKSQYLFILGTVTINYDIKQ